MNRFIKKLCYVSIMSLCLVPLAHADKNYRITVTNLTKGQIFSPIFAVSHNHNYQLFEAGQPASGALAALAEDADTTGLNQFQLGDVDDISESTGPILPGASASVDIEAQNRRRLVSVASMLVVTNDAFLARKNIRLPSRSRGKVSYFARAYDAGSENNDESCAYIPGPPCNNPFKKSDVPGEGYVYIHSGIHGIADLAPAAYDWRNPVARITIERIR